MKSFRRHPSSFLAKLFQFIPQQLPESARRLSGVYERAARAIVVALSLSAALPVSAEDTLPPIVEIASPASGRTLCGTVIVSAAASDDVGVVGVQFKHNGINFGSEDTTAPFTVFAKTWDVPNGTYTLTAVARDAAGNQTTSAPVSVTVSNPSPYFGPCKFIPTFIGYYGQEGSLVPSLELPYPERNLAKFDLIDINRYLHNDYNGSDGSTWVAIKNINPDAQIYLYEMGSEDANYHDSLGAQWRWSIDRYGDLNANYPQLFLTDSLDNRVYNKDYSNVPAPYPPCNDSLHQCWYLMDFGSADYADYWVEAVNADIITQAWAADGVFADNCIAGNYEGSYSPYKPGPPAAYPDNTSWNNAMNSFVGGITAGLHGYNQKLWCNRGQTEQPHGSEAWLALDVIANPPDVVTEEGAFAVAWGNGDVQFYPEDIGKYRLQIETMSAISNSKVTMLSHTGLPEPQAGMDSCGTDNYGAQVCYWQTLWYSLASFLLTKNDQLNNAYFMFAGNGPTYSKIWWYDEYDMIDLGAAMGPYTVTTIGNARIYSREFEKGYVYVNATQYNASSITLPQACRQRTHENLFTPSTELPVVTSIPLNAHHAAILLKP